jgi:MFS family permease
MSVGDEAASLSSSDSTETAGELPPQPAGYRNYAVGLLMVIFTLNFLDRQVINILAEPIKRELHLADWQIGAMSGLAFALLYTIAGLPIARIAERGNRPYIIAVAVTVWSVLTAACGLAQTFAQLILCRFGVGIGEAGCTPPAQSLIVDYVSRAKRASMLAFYHIGSPLGTLVGMVMGGLVADAYGWRTAFFVAGAPGVIFGLLAFATLREPRKQYAEILKKHTPPQSTFAETLKLLWSKRAYRNITLASAFKSFIVYGQGPFMASYFFRVHSDEVAQMAARFGLKSAGFLGLTIGMSSGIAGILGAWLGGQLADRLATRDARWYPTIPALAALVTLPTAILALTVQSAALGLVLLFIPSLLGGLWYGPVHTAHQSLVPAHMRATGTAVFYFVLNLIGLGLGPLLVGLLSDYLAGPMHMGEAQGVRWALIVANCIALVTFWLYWRARKTIRDEIES